LKNTEKTQKDKEPTALPGLDLVEYMASQINGSIEFKIDSVAVTTIIFSRSAENLNIIQEF
jgi:hypothetical protein